MGGFHVIDVTTPSSPALLSTTPIGGNGATSVVLAGHLAYVAEHVVSVRILDVTNPASPSDVGTFPVPENIRGLAVRGDALYVATTSGLHTVDVSDPANPSETSFDPRYFEAIEAAGAFAFAVAGEYQTSSDREVVVMDLATPFAPVQVARVEAGASGQRLHREGDLLYVACGRGGFQVIDVSVPTDPRNIGGALPDLVAVPNPDTRDVAVVGDLVYAAEGAGGIRAYPVPCTAAAVGVAAAPEPGALAAIRAIPSPTRDGTTLSFSLDRSRWARLSVHDVRGRLVRTVTEGPLAAGPHAVGWDGLDSSGAPVPAGVYFVRLRAGALKSTAKVVRTR